MVRIVSDTGPIIGLAKIGKIDLLKNMADEILTGTASEFPAACCVGKRANFK
jgi:predicted nucleic acid-binding protein